MLLRVALRDITVGSFSASQYIHVETFLLARAIGDVSSTPEYHDLTATICRGVEAEPGRGGITDMAVHDDRAYHSAQLRHCCWMCGNILCKRNRLENIGVDTKEDDENTYPTLMQLVQH